MAEKWLISEDIAVNLSQVNCCTRIQGNDNRVKLFMKSGRSIQLFHAPEKDDTATLWDEITRCLKVDGINFVSMRVTPAWGERASVIPCGLDHD